MRDLHTTTTLDAGLFDRMHNGADVSDAPALSDVVDLGVDTSDMHRCPFGCAEWFKTEGRRFKRHVALHTPENDPWL